MFADDQVIISDNEGTIQRDLHEVNKILLGCNLDIFIKKEMKCSLVYYL
jgi:hypothetical protein